jgi:DNA-binding transcriptional LysR family regulator
LSEAVENIVSNRLTDVVGTLRLSAMPNVSETLLTPLITAFQASYPNVRVQVLVTERMVDLIAEGVDLAFRLGQLKDSSLVARKVLTYRHQLVASPSYLRTSKSSAGPSGASAYHFCLLEARVELDLYSQERKGQRNSDFPTAPFDE